MKRIDLTLAAYLEILGAIVATVGTVALCVFCAYGVACIVEEWREW